MEPFNKASTRERSRIRIRRFMSHGPILNSFLSRLSRAARHFRRAVMRGLSDFASLSLNEIEKQTQNAINSLKLFAKTFLSKEFPPER